MEMIRIMPKGDNTIIIAMEIQAPHESVFYFLQSKGYEVKSWLWKYQDESFPGGQSSHETWTFTATKEGENQNEGTMFLTVLEKEIKQIVNEIQNR